jgi:hypothetical protein
MRARDWKKLVEDERDRLVEGAAGKRREADRLLKTLHAEARIMEESADALDRVLQLAEGDPDEDAEPEPVAAQDEIPF